LFGAKIVFFPETSKTFGNFFNTSSNTHGQSAGSNKGKHHVDVCCREAARKRRAAEFDTRKMHFFSRAHSMYYYYYYYIYVSRRVPFRVSFSVSLGVSLPCRKAFRSGGCGVSLSVPLGVPFDVPLGVSHF
jgi:hypothetical protein